MTDPKTANPARPRAAASGESGPLFDAIYAEHFAFVWRYLRAVGVRGPSLDDVAQDVFLVVHRRLAEFRGDSTVRSWLAGIARNVAGNHRRFRRRKLAVLQPLPDEVPNAGPDPLERAQDLEAAAFVQRFIATLDARRRDVFVLATLEQMPLPEVAAALGIPLNTAYTRLRRARGAFEQAVRGREEGRKENEGS